MITLVVYCKHGNRLLRLNSIFSSRINVEASKTISLFTIYYKRNHLSNKIKNEAHISGRRMLIWAPGNWVRLSSFSRPHAHVGIIENFAVPERMESLPFH